MEFAGCDMKEKRMDINFRKRLQRRLHYGDVASLDVPSLPLTELAVDYFHDSIPEKLGQVDLYSASNVIRRNHVSPCSVMLSMLYAKRLKQKTQRNKDLLQSMSSADVFFISMMMASKYLYDEGVEEEVFNDIWAENTDQDVDEVNQMEIDFLQALDWRLFVRPQEFEDTLAAIERRLALQEGLKRGWYTYTEMDILMSSDFLWAVWTSVGWECSKLLAAISAAYLSSVISLLGSTALAVHVSGHLSSITVALLTLRASHLLHVAPTGLPPSLLTLSDSVVPMLSPVTYVDTSEANTSEMSDASFVKSRQSEPAAWSLGHDGEHVGLVDEFGSPRKPGSQETGRGNDSRQTDGGGQRSYDPPAETTKTSLWSVWWFDSLVSQLWAVIGMRSRLTDCFHWSVFSKVPSSKEPNNFGRIHADHEFIDKQSPQFLRKCCSRHKETADTTARKLPSRLRTSAEKTSPTGNEVHVAPSISGISDEVSSPRFKDGSLGSDSLCQKRLTSLPDIVSKIHPSDSVTDYSEDYLTHHSWDGQSFNCRTDNFPRRQHITGHRTNMQPSGDVANNCQVSPQFQTGLEIRIGFFTSVSHAILAT